MGNKITISCDIDKDEAQKIRQHFLGTIDELENLKARDNNDKLMRLHKAVTNLEMIAIISNVTDRGKPAPYKSWIVDLLEEQMGARFKKLLERVQIGALIHGLILAGCPRSVAIEAVAKSISSNYTTVRDAHSFYKRHYSFSEINEFILAERVHLEYYIYDKEITFSDEDSRVSNALNTLRASLDNSECMIRIEDALYLLPKKK